MTRSILTGSGTASTARRWPTRCVDRGDDWWGWDWGDDWYDYGDDYGGDYGGGDSGDTTPPEVPYPPCIEAAPAGVSSTDLINAAKAAAADIASRNDENQEFGAFIYSLNGQVHYSTIFTNGSPDQVDFNSGYIPAGAHLLGFIHNHPDQSGIDDGYPSPADWHVYNTYANATGVNFTVDPNMLQFIYTNQDGQTRAYDKTDKNQNSSSCAL